MRRSDYENYPRVELELLPKRGTGYKKSGLNWGQRGKRDKNQGYLRVPGKVAISDFFPPTGTVFTITPDVGQPFMCKVSQAGRKAIHSSPDTSQMGVYFRGRLGVVDEKAVTRKSVKQYNRSSVSIYKRGPLDYLLCFASTRAGK